VPDKAAVVPALSILYPCRFKYVLKRSNGGKSKGRGWSGRACCARIRVARRAGGTGFSVRRVSRYSDYELESMLRVQKQGNDEDGGKVRG
jgi:hypothetical protein